MYVDELISCMYYSELVRERKKKKNKKVNVIGNVTKMMYDVNEKYVLQNNLWSLYEIAS